MAFASRSTDERTIILYLAENRQAFTMTNGNMPEINEIYKIFYNDPIGIKVVFTF